MEKFDVKNLKKLYVPSSSSTKGENGKVLVIGGSHLFHSSAFWALEIATKLVDMVYFSSTPMNNDIVKKLKTKFLNGIVVDREKVGKYIKEADATLIGPGLPRPPSILLDQVQSGGEIGDDDTKILTEKWLERFPNKKWVIDGGSLQVIKPEILPKRCIVTPNKKEFKILFNLPPNPENALSMAKKYHITILLKGEKDYVCSPDKCVEIEGGNAGMTKGGTGDVLAGLTASLFAKNDAFLSAICASYINKKSGEALFEEKGLYFNASDLVEKIPEVMKKYILS